MALLMPSAAIARHWHGALAARLKRVPLENFLRARALRVADAGASKDSDNVARATIFIVEHGLELYLRGTEDCLAEPQHAVIGQAACSISRALAILIHEPASWRIAALVSAAQLLRPWLGLNAAAHSSASAAQEFTAHLRSSSQGADSELGECASMALVRDDGAMVSAAAVLISERLASAANRRRPVQAPLRFPASR